MDGSQSERALPLQSERSSASGERSSAPELCVVAMFVSHCRFGPCAVRMPVRPFAICANSCVVSCATCPSQVPLCLWRLCQVEIGMDTVDTARYSMDP